MRFSTAITEDGTVYICDVHRRRDAFAYIATLSAIGTFGGGTISWLRSDDGGTTKIAIKDFSGTPLTSISNDSFDIQLGNTNTNSETIKIYATMAGSTNPSLTVSVSDNR